MSSLQQTFPIDYPLMQQFTNRTVSPYACVTEVPTDETTTLCMAIWNVWETGDEVRTRLLLKSAKENVKKRSLTYGLYLIAILADRSRSTETYTSFVTLCREMGLDIKK